MKNIKGLVVGVGGQGIISFTRVLGEACVKKDLPIIVSEVHGMAQRGGVVESSININGKSPLVGEGEADFIVAFEPAEALRFLKRAKKQAKILVSKEPVLPPTVKEGLAEYPDLSPMFEKAKSYFSEIYFIPGQELAKQAGTTKALNIVMLGACIALNIFPLSIEEVKTVITEVLPKKIHEVNLKAVTLGYECFS